MHAFDLHSFEIYSLRQIETYLPYWIGLLVTLDSYCSIPTLTRDKLTSFFGPTVFRDSWDHWSVVSTLTLTLHRLSSEKSEKSFWILFCLIVLKDSWHFWLIVIPFHALDRDKTDLRMIGALALKTLWSNGSGENLAPLVIVLTSNLQCRCVSLKCRWPNHSKKALVPFTNCYSLQCFHWWQTINEKLVSVLWSLFYEEKTVWKSGKQITELS